MSIHRSLRGVDTLKGDRSVLTRIERIQTLKKEGRFDVEEGSPWNLPKVRTKFKSTSVKKAKAAAAGGKDAKDAKPAKEAKEAKPAKGAKGK